MSQSQSQALSPAQVAAAILQGAVINGRYTPPALRLRQPIGAPKTLTNPSTSVVNQINFNASPIGILCKFYVFVQVTFTAPNSSTLTRGPFGPSQILSQILFTDLNNIGRHSTSGKHMMMVNSVKQRWAAGAAAVTDTPFNFGSNFGGGPQIAPASITGTGQSVTISEMFEIPVMYQENDFRGAIYLGTTQAAATLSLILNNAMFVASTADLSDAVYGYTGGTAPTITNVTATAYQEFFDQIPTGSDSLPLLPIGAMNQIYQLQNQTVTGIVANTDFGIPFTNLRNYLSTIAEYDNGGVLNPGSDINYWSLVAANMYQYFKLDPVIQDYLTRRDLSMSMPNGVYYFNFRNQPINTSQYGNTQLNLNAKSATSPAVVKLGHEFFSTSATLAGGGSIQSA